MRSKIVIVGGLALVSIFLIGDLPVNAVVPSETVQRPIVVVRPPSPAGAGNTATVPAESATTLQERDIPQDYELSNPFSAKSWAPEAPPVAPLPPRVVAPVAPPFPFTLVGVLETGSTDTVYYLSSQNQEFPVQVGGTVAGQYRLQSANDKELVFTYLPLQTTQTLKISE